MGQEWEVGKSPAPSCRLWGLGSQGPALVVSLPVEKPCWEGLAGACKESTHPSGYVTAVVEDGQDAGPGVCHLPHCPRKEPGTCWPALEPALCVCVSSAWHLHGHLGLKDSPASGQVASWAPSLTHLPR